VLRGNEFRPRKIPRPPDGVGVTGPGLSLTNPRAGREGTEGRGRRTGGERGKATPAHPFHKGAFAGIAADFGRGA